MLWQYCTSIFNYKKIIIKILYLPNCITLLGVISCKDTPNCVKNSTFLEYLKNDFYTSNNQKTISDKFGYTLTNGKNAINKYLNLLVSECLQNLENGILQLKDFAPKPPTKTQKLKQLQKSVKDFGLSIKIPLRKPSTKELLNQFKKKIETRQKPL